MYARCNLRTERNKVYAMYDNLCYGYFYQTVVCIHTHKIVLNINNQIARIKVSDSECCDKGGKRSARGTKDIPVYKCSA